MDNDDVEIRISEFEHAWHQSGPSEIADFLDRPPALGAENRLRLLVELLCVDLEFRWKNRTEAQPLESYAARFPELGTLEEIPLEIIGQEYRVRRQWGDRPSHEDFTSRFPSRQEQLRAELTRIDRELREEEESLSPRADRPHETIADPSEIEKLFDLDIAMFDYHDLLLKRMIGAGRTGKVYEARQNGASRTVAVKFLRKSLLRQPGILRRFVAEAGFIVKLQHPNIVEIHGLGCTPAGGCFLVMEHVAGPNLDLVIRTGPVSVEVAARWVIEVCKGIEHAHENGVIHCDLKPANLLMDGSGGIKVTDFGLARSLNGPAPGESEIEGTAPYMAPEQASRYWGEVGVRTDVYGVGAILFTVLTGRPPWIGRSLPDILTHVIGAAPVPSPSDLRPDLPEAINTICRTCLSKRPDDRYPTIRHIRTALIEILG
jgi:eukaryotic-like serine/threonine-protein kinase